jgi:hypothetical protein
MHGGLIGHARQSIQQARYAKPWQQALLCAVLIAVGVALTVTGELIGLVPAVLGLLFIGSTVRRDLDLRRSRRAARLRPPREPVQR